MTRRLAVQCGALPLALLTAAALAGCGGSATTAQPAAAAAAPRSQQAGRLRHAEYVALRRAVLRSQHLHAASAAATARLRSACALMRPTTNVLAANRADCMATARWVQAALALPARLRGCTGAAAAAPRCFEAALDGFGARSEAVVRQERAVHRALVARHLPHACRSARQSRPCTVQALRDLGGAAREASAEVDASDLPGLVSAAQRIGTSGRRLARSVRGPDRTLARLRRCPHR
ncbi:MAG: hypothetical protein ACXVFN_21920 [Solirubrobacteraceae bacterium]